MMLDYCRDGHVAVALDPALPGESVRHRRSLGDRLRRRSRTPRCARRPAAHSRPSRSMPVTGCTSRLPPPLSSCSSRTCQRRCAEPRHLAQLRRDGSGPVPALTPGPCTALATNVLRHSLRERVSPSHARPDHLPFLVALLTLAGSRAFADTGAHSHRRTPRPSSAPAIVPTTSPRPPPRHRRSPGVRPPAVRTRRACARDRGAPRALARRRTRRHRGRGPLRRRPLHRAHRSASGHGRERHAHAQEQALRELADAVAVGDRAAASDAICAPRGRNPRRF